MGQNFVLHHFVGDRGFYFLVFVYFMSYMAAFRSNTNIADYCSYNQIGRFDLIEGKK